MNVGSIEHFEPFRSHSEFKAALLLATAAPATEEARFERSARNTGYWPPIEKLASEVVQDGNLHDTRQTVEVYGQTCWLLRVHLAPMVNAPCTISLAAADSMTADQLVEVIRDVTRNFWYGSYFFK